MQIIIFGAPGVGKGTQAKILSNKFNVEHISTGDILRSSIARGTELGLSAKEVVESGSLVSDDLMGGLVKETLENMDYKSGFILDGFPRTLEQCKLLDVIFEELGIDNPFFVILTADTEVLVDRLTARRLCTKCGKIINITELDETNNCPSCGANDSCVKREDDKDEVVRKRLNIYESTTFPVIDYYKEKYRIVTVNGTESIDFVSTNIVNELSK